MEIDLAIVFFGILALSVGSLIGYLIVKKTKFLDKFTEGSKKIDHIVNNPELLKEKIFESVRKLNPDAKGEIKLIDNGDEIILEVKEKDGKKVLDFTRKEYTPAKEEISPMQMGQHKPEKATKPDKDKNTPKKKVVKKGVKNPKKK